LVDALIGDGRRRQLVRELLAPLLGSPPDLALGGIDDACEPTESTGVERRQVPHSLEPEGFKRAQRARREAGLRKERGGRGALRNFVGVFRRGRDRGRERVAPVGEHVGRCSMPFLGVLREGLLEEADERVGDGRVEVAGFDGGALDELWGSFAVAVDRRVPGRHLEEGYGCGVPLGCRIPMLTRASAKERVEVGRRTSTDGGSACLGEREVEEDEVLGSVTLLFAYAEVRRLDVAVIDARRVQRHECLEQVDAPPVEQVE
jgi:hypothetical protein